MAGVEMAWRLAPTLLSAVSFAVIKGIATRQLKGSLISKEAKPTEVEALGDRAVGFLHALVSSMAALWLMGVEQSTGVGLDAAHLCEPMPGFRQLSAFSSGYFLFDLVRRPYGSCPFLTRAACLRDCSASLCPIS
jgi:hypothetical protein